jgi:hypothetical protein
MNLHQKIVEVRKSIDGFTKDSKSFNYSYVSGTQVLSKIQEKMNELGILLVPKITDQSFQTYDYQVYNKNTKTMVDKTDFIVHGNMSYTWINAEEPSDILEIPFYYTGQQDDISKAFGSGLTYTERYFLLKFFNLPTDDADPDARDTTGRTSGNKSSKASAKQLDFIDNLIKKKETKDMPWVTLYAGLKKRMETDVEMENWTPHQASKAIKILQGDKK